MAPPRVLLADDEPATRRQAREILTGAGFEVLEVADGSALVITACDARPQVILADALLPGLDGFEAVAELRRHEATAAIPWLYLSTLSEAETKTQGVARFLMKPFERQEVIEAVQSVAPVPAQRPEGSLPDDRRG
ncbi:MAG: response regulator, partial [Candidatus Omnitrophica bacterium]|nr:response regulator [Candidatus Omnitrophota bacterium]